MLRQSKEYQGFKIKGYCLKKILQTFLQLNFKFKFSKILDTFRQNYCSQNSGYSKNCSQCFVFTNAFASNVGYIKQFNTILF